MSIYQEQLPCRWQVTYKIKPSLRKTERLEGFLFEVHDGQTFVNIEFETPFQNMMVDIVRHEYIEDKYVRHYKSVLEDIMLMRMIYLRAMTPLSIEIISRPTLLNKDELNNAGYKLERLLTKDLVISYNILDVDDSLKSCKEFWDAGFKNKASGREDDVLRIADWLQRAETETDIIKKFILLWIAFNGLYGLVWLLEGKSVSNNNWDKIELTLKLLLENNAQSIVQKYDHIIATLENFEIVSDRGKNFSQQLKSERQSSNNPLKIIELAARCIYVVRKQVFHEAPRTDDVLEMAKVCSSLLTPIMNICLKNVINF